MITRENGQRRDNVGSLRKALAKFVRTAKSKPPRTLADVLLQDVWLPDGPKKGTRFRFETQPVTRLFADAFDSGDWDEFVISGPSQSGKTLIGYIAPLLYHTCELGEPYILGIPDENMGATKWDADFKPILTASPALRPFLPTSGAGSAGGKVRGKITLSTGVPIYLKSAGGDDVAKAGDTARVVGVTEAARFSSVSSSSVESDPLRQLRARQRSYPEEERRTYVEGTVTTKDELPQQLHGISSKTEIVAPCPHCKEHINPGRDDLHGWQDAKSELEAGDLTHFRCPLCEKKITEKQRRAALLKAVLLHDGQKISKRGRVTGPKPETRRLWFHYSAWHNMLLPASNIGKDEWRLSKLEDDTPAKYSAEKEICQFVWSIPWTPPKYDDDLELDERKIAGRRNVSLRRGTVPSQTKHVTVGVDLGSRVGWYLTLATLYGDSGVQSRHIPDYGRFDIPSTSMPLKQAIRYALSELWDQLKAGYTQDGRSGKRKIDCIWYDCGYQPDPVLDHVAKLVGMNREGVHLGAYGRGVTSFEKVNYSLPKKTGNEVREIDANGMYYIMKVARKRTHAAYWDSDNAKYQVQQALTLPDPTTVENATPGWVQLHAGTMKEHERLARHVTNEKLLTVIDAQGAESQKWKRTGANHLFDCFAMAKVAADRLENITPEFEDDSDWYD